MKTEHTPGPWKAQKPRGPQHAIDRKWEVVAPMRGGEQVIVGEHTGVDCLREANARLIAAAPELLAALAAVVNTALPHLIDTEGDQGRDLADALADASAAIAKATKGT
jgi:hypothetical protein